MQQIKKNKILICNWRFYYKINVITYRMRMHNSGVDGIEIPLIYNI